MSKIYTSADQLIGHTPLLELTHIEAAEGLEAKLLAKLEYFNPAGSVKDRIAKAMLDDAEAAGKLNKFYEENCLLQMEFVRSDLFQGTVEHYIADAAKKLGGSVKFVTAVRFQTGEGIEKKQEDFAAEVAAQMNMGK